MKELIIAKRLIMIVLMIFLIAIFACNLQILEIRMVIEEFSFGNYRSFKEVQTLRMQAAKIVSPHEELDKRNVMQVNEKTKLLKSKLIYGANASGKSNVMKALFVFVSCVRQCLTEDSTRLVDPFMYSTETENEPSYFQLIFYIDGVRYRYGFEASKERIHSEWLFMTHTVREVPAFIRDDQEIVEISRTHMSKGYDISKLKNKLFTEKVLFLTLASTFNDEVAGKVMNAIISISFFTTLDVTSWLDDEIKKSLVNNELRSVVLDFLKVADMGIEAINPIQKKDTGEGEGKEETWLLSSHKKYDKDFKEKGKVDFLFEAVESDGTQQMLRVSPFLIKAIRDGNPFIIDEFGARLHPLLTKEILGLFNEKGNEKAQLIAITHSTELMSSELLRKDQIDFVEKDKFGRSYLYTLVEMKGVRKTASFKNDYFKGKYGAIPFLGNWEEMERICDDTIKKEDEE